MGPQGATFSQPIQLTFIYSGYPIPAGVAEEDLIIAYWDATTGQWVPLDDCVVDTTTKRITGTVTHFTPFTVIGYPPAPANYAVSNLTVTPSTIVAGASVTISATVTNNGGSSGTYSVVLKINGTEEAKKDITLEAGGSETVDFPVTRSAASPYNVDVNGQTASFVVTVPTPTTTTTQTPTPIPTTPTSTTTTPTPTTTPVPTTTPTPTPTTTPTTTPAPTPSSTNWLLIGGIIGGVVVIAVIIVIIRKRN